MSTLPETLTAILARIEATSSEPTTAFDVIGIMDALLQRGVELDDVTDMDFLKLLTLHTIEDKTELPCPAWCQYEPRHVFESHSPSTGMQTRPHSLILASGEGMYVALVQEDHRVPGVDATATQGPVFVSVEIEGDFETGSALRRAAGELLNAADKLDALTADDESAATL